MAVTTAGRPLHTLNAEPSGAQRQRRWSSPPKLKVTSRANTNPNSYLNAKPNPTPTPTPNPNPNPKPYPNPNPGSHAHSGLGHSRQLPAALRPVQPSPLPFLLETSRRPFSAAPHASDLTAQVTLTLTLTQAKL